MIFAIASLGACTSNAEPAKVSNNTIPADSIAKKKANPDYNFIQQGTGRLAFAVQCSAKTKAGTQCKRKTKAPEGLCHIHYR